MSSISPSVGLPPPSLRSQPFFFQRNKLRRGMPYFSDIYLASTPYKILIYSELLALQLLPSRPLCTFCNYHGASSWSKPFLKSWGASFYRYWGWVGRRRRDDSWGVWIFGRSERRGMEGLLKCWRRGGCDSSQGNLLSKSYIGPYFCPVIYSLNQW